MRGYVIVFVSLLGGLLMAGCGDVGSPTGATPGRIEEVVGALQPTQPPVGTTPSEPPADSATALVPRVGTSVCSGGSVISDPLVPRDASGSPIPQTPSPQVARVLTPDASGMVQVTLDDFSSSVEMKVGDRLELTLGDVYEWEITVEDPSILSVQAMSPGGSASQGIYGAVKAGRTRIEGSGEPFCRNSNPPCGMPSRAISVEVVVK